MNAALCYITPYLKKPSEEQKVSFGQRCVRQQIQKNWQSVLWVRVNNWRFLSPTGTQPETICFLRLERKDSRLCQKKKNRQERKVTSQTVKTTKKKRSAWFMEKSTLQTVERKKSRTAWFISELNIVWDKLGEEKVEPRQIRMFSKTTKKRKQEESGAQWQKGSKWFVKAFQNITIAAVKLRNNKSCFLTGRIDRLVGCWGLLALHNYWSFNTKPQQSRLSSYVFCPLGSAQQ